MVSGQGGRVGPGEHRGFWIGKVSGQWGRRRGRGQRRDKGEWEDKAGSQFLLDWECEGAVGQEEGGERAGGKGRAWCS